MKSQVAAEVAAAASLARSGWRPARGELLIAAVVDEETGGELGAQWITQTHPEKVRCDMLVNEGGGAVFEYEGRRRYGVCCAEKGVFRFTLTTDGVAGHASMPAMGENALLKMGPVLDGLAARQPSYRLTAEPQAFLRGIGEDPSDPAGVDRAPARGRRAPGDDVRADARRDVHADADQGLGEDQRDPQPSRAESRLPRPAGPGRGGGARGDRRGARRRAGQGLHRSSSPSAWSATAPPISSPLMDAISGVDLRARSGCGGRARDPAGLHRLAPLPRGVPGVRGLRLLSPAPPVAARERLR